MSNVAVAHHIINAYRTVGKTDEQIAEETGYHITTVRAIPLPKLDPAKERAVQHMQIQALHSTYMPKAIDGDMDAANLVLKVQRRQADLLGLDAPKEVVSHNFNTNMDIEGMTPEQLRELSTEELKLIVLRQAASQPIDVTPSERTEDTE